jgi:hypothetical protein
MVLRVLYTNFKNYVLNLLNTDSDLFLACKGSVLIAYVLVKFFLLILVLGDNLLL